MQCFMGYVKSVYSNILILELHLLCTVKLIGQTVYRIPPNSEYYCLERQDSIENTCEWSFK